MTKIRSKMFTVLVTLALAGAALTYSVGSNFRINLNDNVSIILVKFEQAYSKVGVEHPRMLTGWNYGTEKGGQSSSQKELRKRFAVKSGQTLEAWVTLHRSGKRKVTVTQYDSRGNVVETRKAETSVLNGIAFVSYPVR